MQKGTMRWLTAAIRVCLGVTAFCQLTRIVSGKVCADLVGAGGVGVRIWPTIKASPIRIQHHLTFRLVQINWEAEEIFEGDWVGVFPKDPRSPARRVNPLGFPTHPNETFPLWDMPAPLYWATPYATHGQLTSNVTQGRIELQMLAAGGCVGVWAAFIRNGLAVAADCLASHPNWLWQNRDVLGSRSVRSLIIPGTHNSGSFTVKDEDDVVSAWVVCQDEDIISQLLYGIRYLDLRVAYYPHTPEMLWVNHDLVQWRPLVEVLSDVQTFLTLSRDPIIIDIHRTPVGFEFPEAVPLLLSLMNSTFGRDFLPARYGPQVTLDQIWSAGKRIIFAFIDSTVADEEDWIWPRLPQAWANAQILGDLQHYLDGQMTLRQSSPRIWAGMAHLTPSFWDVILRSHEGVRGLSDRVNRPITTWLRERWAHLANIFATDFFRGNNVINTAIRTNLALSVCPSGGAQRPRYSYKSPSYLRRPTELPGKFSSSMTKSRRNFNEAMINRPSTSSTTLSPLLQTLSTPSPANLSAIHSTTSMPDAASVMHDSSFETGQFPQEINTGFRKPNHIGLPIISPIHSLLDIFGFKTTSTSTIASRLLPREDYYDDEDADYPIVNKDNTQSDYDPETFDHTHSQRQDKIFIPSQTSHQLPLILETSMSIALQRDYEEDEFQNSGDIPFKFSLTTDDTKSTPSISPFEKQDKSQEFNMTIGSHDKENLHGSPVSYQENTSVSTSQNHSLRNSQKNNNQSQFQGDQRGPSENIESPQNRHSSSAINRQNYSSITNHQHSSDNHHLPETIEDFS